MAVHAPRKIIHVDMDSFFAAVESRDQPQLAGRPLAVGGDPQRRGVISTCNYQARAFGVHSAMASARALRLCPELIILRPDFAKYRAVADRIREIFSSYTPLVEPLSLDEAFLDVTDHPHHGGSASRTAAAIRERIRRQEGLTASAGVAPNKFLAKVASEWRKPDGQFVVTPAAVSAFVRALPVTRIFGVGRVTAGKLHRHGITTCADLQRFSEQALVDRFGVFGARLFRLCRGDDGRPVRPHRQRKSLSVEHTFAVDLRDRVACEPQILRLYGQLQERLGALPDPRSRQVTGAFVKVKFSDFKQTTAQRATAAPELADFLALCADALGRHKRAVRLLGIGVRFAAPPRDGEVAPDPGTGSAQGELFP